MARLPSRYEMEARFWELSKRRDSIREKADPVRAKRDKLAQKHQKEIEKANAEVKAVEKGLFDIDQEIAMISRALGGKITPPEQSSAPSE